jgi:hypothetical protein
MTMNFNFSKKHEKTNWFDFDWESINHTEGCYSLRRHTRTSIPKVNLPLLWCFISIAILTQFGKEILTQ